MTKQPGIFRRYLDWWYRFTSLKPPEAGASLRERDRFRRSRTAGTILIACFHMFAVTTPINFVLAIVTDQPFIFVQFGSVILGLFLITYFNRKGWTTQVIFVLNLIMGALTPILAVHTANGSFLFSQDSLVVLDDLVLQLLMAAALMPPIFVVLFAGINIASIFSLLYFIPHAPAFDALVRNSSLFAVMWHTLLIQIATALICFLWAKGLEDSVRRADRAEEISRLQSDLYQYQQQALAQKQNLEEAVEDIIQIHAQIANGNLDVRVPVNHGNVLWPIAGALNNFLNRAQRWRASEAELGQLLMLIRQASFQAQQQKYTEQPIRIDMTGTPLDQLLATVNQTNDNQSPGHSSEPTPTHRPSASGTLSRGAPGQATTNRNSFPHFPDQPGSWKRT